MYFRPIIYSLCGLFFIGVGAIFVIVPSGISESARFEETVTVLGEEVSRSPVSGSQVRRGYDRTNMWMAIGFCAFGIGIIVAGILNFRAQRLRLTINNRNI